MAKEVGKPAATDWFEQHWTGLCNGRWLLAQASYGNVTNNNQVVAEMDERIHASKENCCNLHVSGKFFKHLRAESLDHEAKLKLTGLHGKFELNPHLSKKGWNFIMEVCADIGLSYLSAVQGGAGQQRDIPQGS